jgi:hypothetical protein
MNLTTISIAAGITRATSDSKHFVVDRERGVLVEEEMSLRRLEQFAREQGAIEPWEELSGHSARRRRPRMTTTRGRD